MAFAMSSGQELGVMMECLEPDGGLWILGLPGGFVSDSAWATGSRPI